MDEEGFPFNEHTETSLSHQTKRRKTTHHDDFPHSRHDQCTFAWICALHIEMAAARAMLDDVHELLPRHADDSNTYILGSIKQHYVVIACLPHGQYGTNNAAIVVTNMMRTFKAIRACLMVGIGGGVPSKADVRLGDIVVGTRVMQCDLGKIIEDGQLQRTAIPRIPHQLLGTAVSALRSKHELSPSQIPYILQQKLEDQPAYGRPNLPDRLFQATYDHISAAPICDECDQSKLVLRSPRMSDEIRIHYGAIASGNQVMRSGTARDDVARQLDVICFEMETSGLTDILPCLPIRGICDYSDSHKSKEWQRYAAATAAAYAREFLEELPGTGIHARCAYMHNSHQRSSVQRRQSLLASLRFEHIDSRRTNIKTALGKTCGWFLNHPYYEAWLDPAQLTQHHGFLWISGKPGAGKSTIMKSVYSSLKKARSNHSITASFFFNARGGYLEKSVVGMYRSLLLQLLEGYPDLQIVLDDPDIVPQSLNGCLSLTILKEIFYNAISVLGQREFTCFVDALDECDEQQVLDMVHYFEDLTEQFSANGTLFRMCFSSRHYPYIVIRQGLRLTLEEQSGHTEDLATYIASRLRIDDPILAEELRSQLLDKAAGVFMWVVLVVDILNKEYGRGGMFLQERLAEIPSDLSALFKDIIRRDNEDMEALLLCVLWLLYAKRPLKPTEFYHAIWSGLALDDLANNQIPDVTVSNTSTSLDRFERYVIGVSKGIAEVTKSRPQTVQFIHESVQDFLIKDKGLHELWPEIGFDCESPGHEKLKQCCNLYLTHNSVQAYTSRLPVEPLQKSQKKSSKIFPFLEYANQHLFYHSNTAAKLVAQDQFLSSLPFRNWIRVNNLFEKFKIRRYTEDASLIYVLAEKGHSELIRTRLRKYPQIHIFGERYNYPLFAALANGRKDTVAALLNSPSSIYEGIDITEGLKFKKDFTEYEDRTPLSWAAQDGRPGIIKLLLLQNETNIHDVDRGGRTPLSRALKSGHTAIVMLLVEKGACVNATNHDMRKALYMASRSGHEAMAKLLIEKGAHVNAHDRKGYTPLFIASGHGHTAVAKLLIEKGADVNAHDWKGYTPLFIASSHGHTTVAKLLIEKGADVNAHDCEGCTPLFQASSHGYETAIKLLIKKGADINAHDSKGWTPLLKASKKCHGPAMRLLIRRGADVNASTLRGETALGFALRHGQRALVKLLIRKGADTNNLNDFCRHRLAYYYKKAS